ncbi:uncharacterized protein LOC129681031 [Psammomys obesus]|uniref:uncharacterized protein LOC129681031 n=1 Tax=Psammomys obesus TaxID=48139 RepID=UPI002452C4F6|nr:uncharacterized protein LOC129681031 [Psammomys obesus]
MAPTSGLSPSEQVIERMCQLQKRAKSLPSPGRYCPARGVTRGNGQAANQRSTRRRRGYLSSTILGVGVFLLSSIDCNKACCRRILLSVCVLAGEKTTWVATTGAETWESRGAKEEDNPFWLPERLTRRLVVPEDDTQGDKSTEAPSVGNWSENFDETLERLRAAMMAINATRLDLSLTEGLSSWVSSAFSFFKEWVGVGLFGTALVCGLVFLLWLVCKLKAQQQRDKVVIAQALVALEQGSSPEIWLSMLKNKNRLTLRRCTSRGFTHCTESMSDPSHNVAFA